MMMMMMMSPSSQPASQPGHGGVHAERPSAPPQPEPGSRPGSPDTPGAEGSQAGPERLAAPAVLAAQPEQLLPCHCLRSLAVVGQPPGQAVSLTALQTGRHARTDSEAETTKTATETATQTETATRTAT